MIELGPGKCTAIPVEVNDLESPMLFFIVVLLKSRL